MTNKMPRKADGSADRSAPRPYLKNGDTFTCRFCGDQFYRPAALIKRGVFKTCGKRECLSQYMRKENNPFWGKTHSQEVRDAISRAATATPKPRKRTGPPKGYKHTPEAREKISAALRERWKNNRDEMLSYIKRNDKPREEQRYRKNFTPWQRRNWKDDKCFWCHSDEDLTLDHIIPVMDGGYNLRENAQTLCRSCNLWKSAYVDRPAHLARLALRGG